VRPGNSDLCFAWSGTADEAVRHLHEHGVEPEVGPSERSGARGTGTSVYFRDPDGSLLELISYE
jgi:catechol 2,3-dioxygenase-like lactoylglutathione lyase family enzyme